MKGVHIVTYILIIVGALNWGLYGLFEYDLVARVLGDMSPVSRIIYVLIGVAAIVDVVTHKKNCMGCCSHSEGDNCDCGHDHNHDHGAQTGAGQM